MALNRIFKTTAFRLSAIYLVVIFAASIVVGTYMGWRTNALLTQQLVETISAEVKGLAEQYREGGSARLANRVASRSRRPGNSLYFFGNHTGQKIAGNLNRIPNELTNSKGGAQFKYVWQQDETQITRNAVGIPFHVGGNLVLIVGRDIEDQLSFINATRNMFFLGLALLAAFGLGAGLWVSRNLLNRISTITTTSKAIMAGDLSERIPQNGSGDELDRLSMNLNTMLARIESLMNGLREVTDNIAHDLKTPINRIRLSAEEALRDKSNPEEQSATLAHIIDEADHLIKTFNALLKIARLEAGADSEQKDKVDLYQVIEEVTELYEPVIEEANMSLIVTANEHLSIMADRQLISQAIANLVDNAIKYSADDELNGTNEISGDQHNTPVNETADKKAPANPKTNRKTIEIGLERFGEKVKVFVADKGAGISPQNRARVFDRFVRLEDSRSRPGSGLGLSMVAAIVQAYNGAISLKDNNPGLRIVLSFPLYQPASS